MRKPRSPASKERNRLYNKQYYLLNSKRIKERTNEWRRANPDRVRREYMIRKIVEGAGVSRDEAKKVVLEGLR